MFTIRTAAVEHLAESNQHCISTASALHQHCSTASALQQQSPLSLETKSTWVKQAVSRGAVGKRRHPRRCGEEVDQVPVVILDGHSSLCFAEGNREHKPTNELPLQRALLRVHTC
jgi:hypothetical protein